MRTSLTKRDTRVQMQALLENNSRITFIKRNTRVEPKAPLESDLRVLISKRDTRVQPQLAKFKSELGDPNPHDFEVGSSDTPSTDLRDYLIRKKSVHQITSQCHCEWLISAVLFDCHCGF